MPGGKQPDIRPQNDPSQAVLELWPQFDHKPALMRAYVLRVFPLCALVPRVQGSSGAAASVQFVWRGHAKTRTTRAGPWPDFALRLE